MIVKIFVHTSCSSEISLDVVGVNNDASSAMASYGKIKLKTLNVPLPKTLRWEIYLGNNIESYSRMLLS